jgi:hypothetical protein
VAFSLFRLSTAVTGFCAAVFVQYAPKFSGPPVAIVGLAGLGCVVFARIAERVFDAPVWRCRLGRRLACLTAAAGEQLLQLGQVEPRGTLLSRTPSLRIRWTTVVAAHKVTICPAKAYASRASSIARMHGPD